MPIQFRCEACGQPIEVDDEAASQMAACPFCGVVRRAPAESDPTIQYDVPVAMPDRTGGTAAMTVPEQPCAPPRRFADRLGWLALIAVGVEILCILLIAPISISIVRAHGPTPDPTELQEALRLEMEARPWITLVSLLAWMALFAMFTLSIVALIRRSRPRWPAAVSLAFSLLFGLMMCVGVLLL